MDVPLSDLLCETSLSALRAHSDIQIYSVKLIIAPNRPQPQTQPPASVDTDSYTLVSSQHILIQLIDGFLFHTAQLPSERLFWVPRAYPGRSRPFRPQAAL